jgi:protein phosphatase PTC1
LSHFSNTGKTSSGCTAVTAFLRVEHADDAINPRGVTNPNLHVRGLLEGKGEEELEAETSSPNAGRRSSIGGGSSGHIGGTASPSGESGNGGNGNGGGGGLGRKMSGRRIRDFVRGLTGSGDKDKDANDEIAVVEDPGNGVEAIEAHSEKGLKRVLYTANVGDARAVLW